MNQAIDLEVLDALAIGATFLAVGAASLPYHESLLVAQEIAQGGAVPLVELEALDDDDDVGLIAIMGAPIAAIERMIDPDHLEQPLKVLERHLGVRCAAVMPIEVCMNAILPLVVAARRGIPMVNADIVGRSLPQLDMTSIGIAGKSLSPFAISDVRGANVIVESGSSTEIETICRAVCGTFGSLASVSTVQKASFLKAYAVSGTPVRAIRIGRLLRSAQTGSGDPIAALIGELGGIRLLDGKIVDMDFGQSGSFVRGRARISALGSDRVVDVSIRNEYLAVQEGGRYTAVAPDLISILDTDTAMPIGAESLRYGLRVSVVVLPAPDIFLSPAGLAVCGPRALGFDTDYFPAREAAA